MDDTESKEAADDSMAAPHLNKPVTHSDTPEHSNEPADSQPWPYTAIERQIAATPTRDYESQSHGATTSSRDRRKKNDRRKTHRIGFGSFLVLLWLVAIGLIVIFTDFDRTLQKVASAAPQIAEKMVSHTPLSADASSSTIKKTPADGLNSEPKNQIADASTEAETATTTEALSIPIADVSLRNRPELLEQFVQVYRSQLASNPQDKATRAALDRLQERSLSDIQTLIAQGDITNAEKSLDTIARVFPELTDNVRYKYLLARAEYMRRQAQDEAITKFEQTKPAAKTIATAKPVSIASPPPVAALPIRVPSPAVTKKHSENISSSKPEIRSVSIIPGTMVDDRFVPSDGGNVFMVELSYSNFDKVFAEQAAATLVALLGVPEDSMVLAEVPIIITADRGTKNFLMETNDVQGYAGGKFQIEFLLNDEFLASRDVRLSKPRP